jgi:hypothetical protein
MLLLMVMVMGMVMVVTTVTTTTMIAPLRIINTDMDHIDRMVVSRDDNRNVLVCICGLWVCKFLDDLVRDSAKQFILLYSFCCRRQGASMPSSLCHTGTSAALEAEEYAHEARVVDGASEVPWGEV